MHREVGAFLATVAAVVGCAMFAPPVVASTKPNGVGCSARHRTASAGHAGSASRGPAARKSGTAVAVKRVCQRNRGSANDRNGGYAVAGDANGGNGGYAVGGSASGGHGGNVHVGSAESASANGGNGGFATATGGGSASANGGDGGSINVPTLNATTEESAEALAEVEDFLSKLFGVPPSLWGPPDSDGSTGV